MKIIELTEEEFNLIIVRRAAIEEEKLRIQRLEEGKQMMIKGYYQVLENGGKISIEGGSYVRSGAYLTEIISTKKGIMFKHNKS